MIVIGIDPGFALLGYAVLELAKTEERVLELGFLETKKSSKKRNVFATEDNVRRMRELAGGLTPLIWGRLRPPSIVCTEGQSWPRSSSTAAKLGMAWGVITTVTTGIPMVQVSPQSLKLSVAGSATASKLDVEAELLARYPNLEELLEPITPSKRNHATDAVASVVACLGSELVVALRGTL